MEETTQTVICDESFIDNLNKKLLNACLVVIYGKNMGHQYHIEINQTLIGRSINADIQIDDDSVSRDHAFIVRDSHGYGIEDNASKNGCFLGDEKVDKAPLSDGDLLRIGNTILKFLSSDNIENAYHEELFRLAKIDGLTNIYNRRHFMESIEQEVDRARRYNRPLSLLMIDIDHFKSVNDTFGHRAGDSVLSAVAKLFLSRSRKVDYVSRYGGEEFAILLPEVNAMGAFQFATKLNKAVASKAQVFEGKEIPITISIGVADLLQGNQSADELITTADRRLYIAKEKGRNCVVSRD